ncbi:MAG: hypothetical protein K8S94_04910 [Planctomycetia bacterium]|nr:hypothetical protein [Planctomycetia bacterium]
MAAAAACLATAVGCSRGLPPPPGTVRVDGVVRYESAPLSRGTVQFAAPTGTRCGSARLDPEGQFTVWLEPGEYRVAVIAYDGIERVDAVGAPLPQNSLIPERYFTPEGSGLAATVDAEHRTLAYDLQK